MKNYIGLLVLMLGIGAIEPLNMGSIAYAQDIIYPYGATIPTDPDLKNLEWNRYTAENIVILSIDNEHGKWLSENIDKVRSWCLTRWGFPESKFTKECRIFCVPNKDLLKKLFNLEQSKVELRKDLTVLWVVLDDKPTRILPPLLTQICLAEFESKHNVKIGWWFKRGASQLNGIVPDIRQSVSGLNDMLRKDQPIFVSEKMFAMTEEDYLKESVENRRIFDQEAIALCIMLRKEFGEAKLQGFLRIASNNNSQDVLKVVYGFSGYGHFDKQYIRFMRDLTSDVLNNKTPDSYLEIRPVH